MYEILEILMLLIFILPVIGVISLFVNKRRPHLTVKGAFKRLAKRCKLLIGEMNIFGDRLISMDRRMNKIALVVYKNDITWEKCVHVRELISCQVEKLINAVSGRIKKVNLEFTFHSEGAIIFSFFDDGSDDLRDLPLRIKKAEYWRRKIQSRISTTQLANADQAVISFG